MEPHLTSNLSPVASLICKDQCDCPEKFDKSKLERGEYIIEALEVNHLSTAMKQLALKFPDEINFKERQCILYAGLSYDNKATRGKWQEFLMCLLNAAVSLLFHQWLRLSPVCYSCHVNFNC